MMRREAGRTPIDQPGSGSDPGFERRDQDAVRSLVLEGMRERWGEAYDPTANSDLDDIEAVLGFDVRDLEPRWAQLWDPAGGVHLNIQGDPAYTPPIWPQKPGEQAMMMHFEVQVDDLEDAIATAIEAGGTESPWQPPDRNRDRIRIMFDPAGHPLCLFLRGE